MIPKIIHYCWFGQTKLPDEAAECIESWKKYFPEYEIRQWNESNFDYTCCDYVKEAYEAGKWAFVSDYARFLILYKYGGIYFDVDVEIIDYMDDLIAIGPFMGCEAKAQAAPGLGMGAVPGLALYRQILDSYEQSHFKDQHGRLNMTTVVKRTTDILIKNGYNQNDPSIQVVAGVSIYPQDYFCPQDYYSGQLVITENTRTIHHYMSSWVDERQRRTNALQKKIHTEKNLAVKLYCYIRMYLFVIQKNLEEEGISWLLRKITGRR